MIRCGRIIIVVAVIAAGMPVPRYAAAGDTVLPSLMVQNDAAAASGASKAIANRPMPVFNQGTMPAAKESAKETVVRDAAPVRPIAPKPGPSRRKTVPVAPSIPVVAPATIAVSSVPVRTDMRAAPSIEPQVPAVAVLVETPTQEEQPITMAVTAYAAKTTAVVTPEPAKQGFKPFYVFTDNKSLNHYYPSGWMGDTQDIKFSGAFQDDSRLGKTCLRVTYLARGAREWAGIYWQNPANNWGTAKGGYDLRGAAYLTFWARGADGGETISEFKLGGLSGKYSDSDVAWIGPIRLKREWTQYRIRLKNKDLRYISGGFCFTVLRSDNPQGCTFYIDEIRYE